MGETIGARIRAARLRYGMSGAELARRVGITPNTLNGIELGKHNPRAETLAAIAQTLGVTSDVLLGLRPDGTDEDVRERCPGVEPSLGRMTLPPATALPKGVPL